MCTPTHAVARAYVVVIGDIVESRTLPDRASVQREFVTAVETFNEREGSALAAPLKLTSGDEMQTILEDPVAAVDVITRMSEELYPTSLIWGVGRGPIETDWARDVTIMDGPCFHRARRAVEEASAEDVWARASGFSPLDDRVLSGLFRLMGAISSSWTDTQRKYIRALRGTSQKDVAERFGVGAAAVSMALQRARYHDFEEGAAVLRTLFAAYREGEEPPIRPSTDFRLGSP